MKQLLFFLFTLLICLLTACNNKTSNDKNDSSVVFGDSIPISNGLIGKVFLLPDTTTKLPDFDTMQPQANSIYINKLISQRKIGQQGFRACITGLNGLALNTQGILCQINLAIIYLS